MTCSITATASIVSTLWGMKTRSWAWSSMLSYCFCWIWLWCWLVFELSVCDGLKLLCFRYLWTRFVITMCTLMYEVLVNYLWNGCNMWLVMLNYCDLGCMQVGLKSFVVSVDYRDYMGSSMAVWSHRWLLSYLCSYKLVGSITPTTLGSPRGLGAMPIGYSCAHPLAKRPGQAPGSWSMVHPSSTLGSCTANNSSQGPS